ncbi:YcxB family protein [Dyadobacter psychrotolerans]|uniref:YcxB family protein n=1 Tax=Dyadobacter psychrotolerans TaxID=2541721 RepID=A0A4R5DRL5_9BACT|nr:YcxB family protein [Dyadobacter psychrotolerans]TDE16337.1 YcxB family protein [Dyadobacter psychrotolerans]
MLKVKYSLSKSDLYNGLVEVSRSGKVAKGARIFGVFLLIIGIFTTTVSLANNSFSLTFGFIFNFIMGIYSTFLSEIATKFQVPQLIKSKNTITEETTLELNEKAFLLQGESYKSELALETLRSVIESKKFFILKVSDQAGYIIPKRVLSDNQILYFKTVVASLKQPKIKLQPV